MSDRFFFPLVAAVAICMIALALVWPQGLGRRAPGPFGHTPATDGGAPPELRPAIAPAAPHPSPAAPPMAAPPAAAAAVTPPAPHS